MTKRYPVAFIEQAMEMVLSRGDRSVKAIALDLSVSVDTLKYWMKNRSVTKRVDPEKERRPQDWSVEEQLQALNETHGLSDEKLQEWCRGRGLFAHHLDEWRSAICATGKNAATGLREVRSLKDQVAQLNRDLDRKDKALAEAAALLILQKKFRALWEREDN